MGIRHSGREAALQMLFQMEASKNPAEIVIGLFWRSFDTHAEGKAYADGIVRGVEEHLDQIDQEVTTASEHWRLERMSRVDRNILRMGVFELLHCKDVPGPVILDEAVELAKAYGTDESSAFVNGVLNRIADVHNRRETRDPEPEP